MFLQISADLEHGSLGTITAAGSIEWIKKDIPRTEIWNELNRAAIDYIKRTDLQIIERPRNRVELRRRQAENAAILRELPPDHGTGVPGRWWGWTDALFGPA